MEMIGLKDFSFLMSTRVIFGIGSRSQLGREARQLGHRALLVVVKGAMRELGVTKAIEADLQAHEVPTVLFDDVGSNPSHEVVQAGAALALEQGCDLVIGLGGGSAMDAAKGIAVVMTHGGWIWDYLDGAMIPGPAAPVICLPTTAGTGSEVTPYAVFNHPDKGRKEGLVSPYLYPRVALVDPELLASCPSALVAACGTDALAQAIESYITNPATPISEMYSLQSIRLCARHLRPAVFNPKNLEAQYGMSLASLLGGVAIATADTVLFHTVAEAIGAFHHVPHGEALGVLLAEGMRYNLTSCLEKYVQIAEAMGEMTQGLSTREAAEKAVLAVDRLILDLGLPRKLEALGVSRESVPLIAKYVMRPGATASNSRVPTEAEVEQLLWNVF
jgi:alcohol dehydrogenase class IV